MELSSASSLCIKGMMTAGLLWSKIDALAWKPLPNVANMSATTTCNQIILMFLCLQLSRGRSDESTGKGVGVSWVEGQPSWRGEEKVTPTLKNWRRCDPATPTRTLYW